MQKRHLWVFFALVAALGWALPAAAQDYGQRFGIQRGGEVDYSPQGPGVLFGPLDPAVRKWYVPQELYKDYGWRQWEYSNYARAGDHYQRYVNTTLEGDYFYDVYGNFISRGWLLYDWRQAQPQQGGSGIFKSSNFGSWFNALTVSADSKGQYNYAITVGNRIRTTLTPMTFSKPAFSGVQIDFASDRYEATVLASRVSDPVNRETVDPAVSTNSTSLVGGRFTAQVGDLVKVGATLVDARNSNTNLDLFSGDLVAGNLTTGQSAAPLTAIAVILSDDTPEDGEGGAALFTHDVLLVSRDFETGRETTFALADVVRPGAEWPIIFGGFNRSGFLAADGTERIIINYDFNDPAYIGPAPTSLVKAQFDYVLANDYKVDMWSDRQTGQRASPTPPLTAELLDNSQPALITVERAEGNVKDISNLQRVRFDYGLPTANLIGGLTLEGTDVFGFDFYGEWDRNKRYFQYPNAALFTAGKQHKISSLSADAWLFNISKETYPFYAFAEGYSVDADYSTAAYVVGLNGNVQYDAVQRNIYEFVEDNDDQDRLPDWLRVNQVSDPAIFPGWDANNDFINDFNQNDNSRVSNIIPDYEEPFLRYEVDRPEYLFGIDINNNAWIDRYEDDDLPDYPYKADRRGYNVFAGAHLTPELRLTLGRMDERMLSTERDNKVNYAMLTMERDYAGVGKLRVFDMLKLAKDTIPDARRPASANVEEIAAIRPVIEDLLPAQDTWINTAWVGFDYVGIDRLRSVNKVKYELYHQNKDTPRDIDGRRLRGNSSFFGLINKVDYTIELGRLYLRPKFKSEYFRRTPFRAEEDKEKQWTGMGVFFAQLPVLNHTTLQGGLELLWLRELLNDEDAMVADGITEETGDLSSTTLALQLSNTADYLGYSLTTQIGLRVGRIRTELVQQNEQGAFVKTVESGTETTSFITVLAGLQR